MRAWQRTWPRIGDQPNSYSRAGHSSSCIVAQRAGQLGAARAQGRDRLDMRGAVNAEAGLGAGAGECRPRRHRTDQSGTDEARSGAHVWSIARNKKLEEPVEVGRQN